MLLYQRIEFILIHLDFVDSHFDELLPVTRRMYATGIANELHQLVSQLTVIDEQMETTLGFEDAYLDVSLWKKEDNQFFNLRKENYYREDFKKDVEINNLIDVFPLNKEDYSFTSTNAEIFKTGLRYLCSDANISSRDYVYAISEGLKNICSLLSSISRKKSNIQDYQYEEFWYKFMYRDDDLIPEEVINDYDIWKEEYDCQDLQVLKDKRTQEILKLLQSGVFSYDVKPVKREIDNCIIEIQEDALEEGIEIPEKINKECARFSKYVTFKEDILCLDYTKLGKYVYKHYGEINDRQGDSLIYFEYMLNSIQEDMAECNPKLKKYLKSYDDNLLEETLNSALGIIDSCTKLLAKGVQKDFLTTYLREAFYDNNMGEVQALLKGQSKYTILCQMLGMLKTTQKVFRLDVTSADIADALEDVIKKPKKDSLKRYIDKGACDHISKVAKWTVQYVADILGSKSERLFLNIAQNKPSRSI